MKLAYKRSEVGCHHLVNTKTNKSVVVVMGPRPWGAWDEEEVARILVALWNEHEEKKDGEKRGGKGKGKG